MGSATLHGLKPSQFKELEAVRQMDKAEALAFAKKKKLVLSLAKYSRLASLRLPSSLNCAKMCAGDHSSLEERRIEYPLIYFHRGTHSCRPR